MTTGIQDVFQYCLFIPYLFGKQQNCAIYPIKHVVLWTLQTNVSSMIITLDTIYWSFQEYSYLSSYWSETFVYDHIAFTVATNTETMTRHNYSNGKIKGCAQTMDKNCIGGKSWFQIMRHLHQGLSWCESYTFKLNILQNRDSVVNSPLRVTHFSF